MKEWELIAQHDRCFTIDGREHLDPANFDSPVQLETLMSFKNMLYQGVHHDFITNGAQRQVAYKLTYKLEKLEGGFFK